MRRVILVIALCFCAFSGWAISVDLSTAGTLATKLTAGELSTTVDLTITGKMNNEDFLILQGSMPALENVDISAVTIEANGPYNFANTIPNAAFNGKSKLKSIVFPVNCVDVFDFAFAGCSSLTSISLPNSVTKLGNGAFQDCIGLTSISLSQFVTDIASTAFMGCSNLPELTISANNPNYKTVGGVLFSKNLATLVAFPAGKAGVYTIPSSTLEIAPESFYGCKGITTLNIPASIVFFPISEGSQSNLLAAINIDAANPNYSSEDGVVFNKNKTIIVRCPEGKEGAYTIPSSVVEIEKYAFWGCSKLSQLTIPNTVITIGNTAFSGCKGLQALVIPNSVTSVGTDFCANCTFLKTVVLSTSLTNLPQYSFIDCSQLATITIPNNIESISMHAFYRCSSLSDVKLSNNLKTLGQGAFAECTGLQSLTIPNGLTLLEPYLFYGCTKLESVDIPISVTSIGERVFQRCTGLKSFIIPSSISAVGAFAFEGCTGLTTCTIPVSVKSIGSEAFENCSGLTSLTAENPFPINLLYSNAVFRGVVYSKCTLYVVNDPIDHMIRWRYYEAFQWKEFTKIVEIVATTATTPEISSAFNAYASNGELVISGAEIGKTITVVDIQGHVVISEKATSSTANFQLKSGVYIVQMDKNSVKIAM